MAQKKQNTFFERLADEIEAPYRVAQASLPATPSEQEQLDFRPQPTEGPLVNDPGISAMQEIISPQVGTPAGETNRYDQTPPAYQGKILNPGILASILRDPKINPEMKMQSIQMLGEFQKMMTPKRSMGRLVPSGSGTYQTVDEEGNVVDTGITVPNKNADSLVWMSKGNRKRQVRESQIPQMEAKGYTQDMPIDTGGGGEARSTREYFDEITGKSMGFLPTNVIPQKGWTTVKPERASVVESRNLNKYSKGISMILKRHGGGQGIDINLLASDPEQAISNTDKSAYAAMKKKAESGDVQAKKDLQQVDSLYAKINEITGGEPPQAQATPGAEKKEISAMPDPVQNKNRTIKDTATGKRYKSDGKTWLEIK
ncbi:MAG: hypothetical protein RBT40_07395 [Petrimonas sp.]|nr:hypothetical protein [Petrimonas sp.]